MILLRIERWPFFSFFLTAISISIAAAPAGAQDRQVNLKGKLETIGKSIVLDGSAITNVGNLQMNITNFGFLGSLPKSGYQMADSPSAQWPAGSGIEYLYAAGLWVGAAVEGIPSVSTGYPETEFYPTDDPIDVIYRAVEGAKGGRTYPANPDDDGDGRINEDWLNGRDDDGDGLIDEDFAQIGSLMYTCWFTDDQPVAQQAWPEHLPLHLKVRQEVYQWSEDGFNDFVGVHYEISNQGGKYIQNVYAGIYADLDAGPRDMPNYYKDDQIGWWSGIYCAQVNGIEMPERFHAMYVYDSDGDNGRTKGYFGVVLLGSSLDAPGFSNPPNAIRIFAGLLPYERGGEPLNDYERYEVMSNRVWQSPTTSPNDYKALMSVGPFYGLAPGQSIRLDIAYVAGEGLDGFLANAAMAKLVYNGIWVDKDKRSTTGVDGRETPVVGPLEQFDPDPCDATAQSLKVNRGDTIWANEDCREELALWNYPGCYKGSMQFSQFRTGINGKEAQVNWITSTVTPPPSMRAVPEDDRLRGLPGMEGRRLASAARDDGRERAERRSVAFARQPRPRERHRAQHRSQETVARRGLSVRAASAGEEPGPVPQGVRGKSLLRPARQGSLSAGDHGGRVRHVRSDRAVGPRVRRRTAVLHVSRSRGQERPSVFLLRGRL